MSESRRKAAAVIDSDPQYPSTWKAFIGQEQAKEQLITQARAAKKRKVPLPHTLIESGRPGIGKTSLALLTAKEMGAGVAICSGAMDVHDARMVLSEMVDGDVLILDECHRLVDGGKGKAEWLLHYMQDGVLITPLGPETVARVTILGCTTEGGRLPETILDRFSITPELTPYSEAEAAKIAQGMARRILVADGLPAPSPENCRQIARATSQNPRVMRKLVEALRDIVLVGGGDSHDGKHYDLTKAMQWLGLTEDGLTTTAMRYMKVLLSDFGGRPAGQTTLQDRLQEPGGLAYTERLLMDKGLLMMTGSGRSLTADGVRRTRAMAEV